MFRWGEPVWLVGLAGVPLLVLLMLWSGSRRKRALDRLGDARLIGRLTDSVSARLRRTASILTVVASALVLVALARPQFGTRIETVSRVGQDIVVALDLSSSMLAEDIAPNRLERARVSILRLMTQLAGDRIALVAFAGDAYLQSPLTTDYTAAAVFLNAMTPAMMPIQGTDLGAALRVSLDALDGGAREARSVLLITDGEDHEGGLDTELARALEGGVIVHAVGIGSTEGVPIPDPDDAGGTGFLRDEDGTVVTSRLDEATLRSLAERTGGRYARAGAGAGFDRLIDDIANVEGEAIDATEITDFADQYQLFVGLALLLILCEWALPDRRRTDD
ncbi:MAG: VWA domain-containing protein [Gemmatimonadetes bacterium]|nr:VWA domain-containing protein [Gemmatimonadota bacterium]